MKKLKLIFTLYKDLGIVDGKQALLPVTESGALYDLITVYVKDTATGETRYLKDYTNTQFPGKALPQAKEFVYSINKQLQELYDFYDRIYAFKNALQALSGDFDSKHAIIKELIKVSSKAINIHLGCLIESNEDVAYWYGGLCERIDLKIETIAFWNPSYLSQKEQELSQMEKEDL